MNNQEKARELQLDCIRNGCGDSTDIRCACEEMAEWKDTQFREYLEKKKAEFESERGTLRFGGDVLDEIINELFSESEKIDNSNNDE